MNDYTIKVEIRDYILSIRDYINLSKVAKACGLSRQAVTFFLMDTHHMNVISVQKLIELRDFIRNI